MVKRKNLSGKLVQIDAACIVERYNPHPCSEKKKEENELPEQALREPNPVTPKLDLSNEDVEFVWRSKTKRSACRIGSKVDRLQSLVLTKAKILEFSFHKISFRNILSNQTEKKKSK